MSEIRVRREVPGDEEVIHRVVAAAFEQEAEADLVDALRKARAAEVSLVAEREGEVVGHILFSPVELRPAIEGTAVGLAPMAVVPGLQRAGIGSALVRAGLERCHALGHDVVVVLGHAKYYPRFGFRPAEELGLRCEYPVPPGIFQAQELRPGALAGVEALVVYHSAFAAL